MYSRKLKKLYTVILAVFVVCVAILPAYSSVSYADDEAFATINIPVRCKIDRDAPAGHKYTYTLTANSAENPMPRNSVDGVKTVVMTDSGRIDFGDIEFSRPDVFYYTIRETTKEWKRFKRDPIEYTAILIADTDGNTKTIVQSSKGEKPDKIVFENRYNKPKPKKPARKPKTGDNLKWLAMGVLCGVSFALLILAIIKRINTNGKEKVKEFQ